MTLREHLLALLSEGSAPGRRGLSLATMERAIRSVGLDASAVGFELTAMVHEQWSHPEGLGLVVTRGGEWWATVLGHRAGKRVPLAPETRAALRAVVRSPEAP